MHIYKFNGYAVIPPTPGDPLRTPLASPWEPLGIPWGPLGTLGDLWGTPVDLMATQVKWRKIRFESYLYTKTDSQPNPMLRYRNFWESPF